MAKVDIRNAYRIVPVHPDDRSLLSMMWEGVLYVDTALPFGLQSAPKIFTAVVDAMEWVAKSKGLSNLLHYLDDFPHCGRSPLHGVCRTPYYPPGNVQGSGNSGGDGEAGGSSNMFGVSRDRGVEVDTVEMVFLLPSGKLRELRELVEQWLRRKSCSL